MKVNKKALAKEFAGFLKMYSEIVEHCELKNDERMSAIYRSKAHCIQDLAMTFFGVENMCGYWRSELIEELEKVAKG
jgi:hypothetical protein